MFTPVDKPVTFGDTKEAGLCSIRVPKTISDTSTITLANGVISKTTKEETKVWGKKADWCDISGTIDGKGYGITIFDHPANPKHPSNWHVRHYGLMSANIFGLSDFDKANPKGSGDFTMQKEKPAAFRYRVVFHTGDAAGAKLDEKYKEYVAAVKP